MGKERIHLFSSVHYIYKSHSIIKGNFLTEEGLVAEDPQCDSVCKCVDPMNSYYLLLWLIDRGLENCRGKWISLNSGFIERILHKSCIGLEIVVVVSRLLDVESLCFRKSLTQLPISLWRQHV